MQVDFQLDRRGPHRFELHLVELVSLGIVGAPVLDRLELTIGVAIQDAPGYWLDDTGRSACRLPKDSDAGQFVRFIPLELFRFRNGNPCR